MSKVYPNYTYVRLTDPKTIRLLDKYNPSMEGIPLSAVIDTAMQQGATTPHFGNTYFWDPNAPTGGDGSITAPFQTITEANAASSGAFDLIVALGGGTISGLTLMADRLYDFNGCGFTINGHITLAGTGRTFVSNLIAFATPDATFITVGASQYLGFYGLQLFPSGTNTIISIAGASSELDLVSYRIQNVGNARILELGTGSPTVSTQIGGMSTDDARCLSMVSGTLSMGSASSLSNNSATAPTAYVGGTGDLQMASGTNATNQDAGGALHIAGATASADVRTGAQLSCSGGGLINKDNAGSTLYICPQSGGDLGTITGTNVGVSSGTAIGYVASDPSGVLGGVPGQIVRTPPPAGTTHICLTGTTWQDIT
jgi:hypothetical protein